jgi:pyruvate dehydrogenase E2 component (dihydrolipoamide acetyltransferase)
MPIKITMPALSPTMEEGKLAKWLKKEGDRVSAGDVIAEIETDKATMEVEAVDEGTLAKILVAEGTEGVKVNAVIALLLAEGEDKAALAAALEGFKSDVGAAPAPAKPAEAPKPAPASPRAPAGGETASASAPAAALAPPPPAPRAPAPQPAPHPPRTNGPRPRVREPTRQAHGQASGR